MPAKVNHDILTAAIEGFEAQKNHISLRIAELRQMMNGGGSEPAAAPGPLQRKRRKVSAAARGRMAEAQRKRWAGVRGETGPTPKAGKAVAKKAKRRLSPEGRKRIIEATKKRWAAFRKAQAKAAK